MAPILRIPSSSLALMLAIVVKSSERAINERALEEINDYPVLTILGHQRFTTHYYDGLEYPPLPAWAAMLAMFADQADMFLAWNQPENRLWRLLTMLVLGLRANKYDGSNPREAKKLLVKASSIYLRGAPLPTQDARPKVYATIQNGIELCSLLHCYLNTVVCCEALGEYPETEQFVLTTVKETREKYPEFNIVMAHSDHTPSFEEPCYHKHVEFDRPFPHGTYGDPDNKKQLAVHAPGAGYGYAAPVQGKYVENGQTKSIELAVSLGSPDGCATSLEVNVGPPKPAIRCQDID
ncbi:hypothetical protein EST38_g2278 [Candolleomyces aberdarensis]|uniref:Uncharacterized protein n=1 Tax=Candolleomyces aberdarensis TaxID=2316362 RepID=A0A4Q2DVV7_9AGAR|nr:hypothetical protein EST38_g2278 [Candolleomyces aberdarensis]